MKKLLTSLGVLFLISGCTDNTESLTCTMDNTVNGLAAATEYKIDYIEDDVKLVTITYDYTDNNTGTNNTDNNMDTDNTTDTDNNTNNNARTTTDNNTNNNTRTTTDNEQIDGINADTDGITENDDVDHNTGSTDSDEVIDGAVGDVIDGTINGVTDTILDIAGIKNTYENQLSSYDNIEGFTYDVDIDEDNQYKIVYKIDLDKISDNDLASFNIDRSLKTTRDTYEGSGYTCK